MLNLPEWDLPLNVPVLLTMNAAVIAHCVLCGHVRVGHLDVLACMSGKTTFEGLGYHQLITFQHKIVISIK
jgi:hypothetical protein